jgi:hypothetical protein
MHLTTYPATLNVAAGLAHYEAAEAELARQPSKRRLGYLYIGMSTAATFAVRTGRLEVASRQAHEIAEELGDEPLAGWASYQRAWCAFNHGRLAQSLSLHERMRDIAGHLDDVNMGSWAAFGRALLSGTYLDDPLTARTWCAQGLALPHLDVFPRQRDNLLDQLGLATGSSGNLAEARQIAREPRPRHSAGADAALLVRGMGAGRRGLDNGRRPRRQRRRPPGRRHQRLLGRPGATLARRLRSGKDHARQRPGCSGTRPPGTRRADAPGRTGPAGRRVRPGGRGQSRACPLPGDPPVRRGLARARRARRPRRRNAGRR